MKRFLTLFPDAENVHLTKDVGMIPYVLHKHFGYDCTLACYRNGEYQYLENEVKGLKIVFMKKLFHNKFFDSVIFLLLNAGKFDILQIYHLNKFSAGLTYIFKLLKFNRGVTYLKLDAEAYILDIKLRGIKGNIFKYLISKINHISIETRFLYEELNKHNILGRKVIYLPNGYYDSDYSRSKISYHLKKKKIITVGRIGTFQKYNEVLLQAFAKFCKHNNDWSLELIGPIEPGFENYITRYFEDNPELQQKVSFAGFISDKKLLADKYNEAQIFVLTSRYEGFALVYLEAMHAGCYIISSAILPALDVTDNRTYGDLFDVGDVDGLYDLLTGATGNPLKLEDNCYKVQDYVENNFNWPVILNVLNNCLMQSNAT